jgi:hypothetical protein
VTIDNRLPVRRLYRRPGRLDAAIGHRCQIELFRERIRRALSVVLRETPDL